MRKICTPIRRHLFSSKFLENVFLLQEEKDLNLVDVLKTFAQFSSGLRKKERLIIIMICYLSTNSLMLNVQNGL